MQPRTEETGLGEISVKNIIVCLVAFACAIGAEMMAESGLSLIDWEAGWAGSGTALAAGMIVAAVIAIALLFVMRKNAQPVSEAK